MDTRSSYIQGVTTGVALSVLTLGAAYVALDSSHLKRVFSGWGGGGKGKVTPPAPTAPTAPTQPSTPSTSSYSGLIGNTRMIRIHSLSAATGCEIWGKAEFMNPGGSGKDRVALAVVEAGEASGSLRPGGVLVEGTSGSTGISLALLAASRGYRARIFLPNDQAQEKAALLRRLGAEVVETPPVSIVHPEHYVNQARASAATTPNALFCDQFETPHNTRAHYTTTGPEVWGGMGGRLDAFVMGAGTGGTLGGVGRYLKEASQGRIKVFLVDPPGSVLQRLVNSGVAYTPQLAERTLRRHRDDTLVEGVGLDRVTGPIRAALPFIDGAWGVGDEEVVAMSRHLLREEGLFCGSSTALNCVGAVLAARALGPGHTIVTVLCDGGARHLSRFWCDQRVEESARKRGDVGTERLMGGEGGLGGGGGGGGLGGLGGDGTRGVQDSIKRGWLLQPPSGGVGMGMGKGKGEGGGGGGGM